MALPGAVTWIWPVKPGLSVKMKGCVPGTDSTTTTFVPWITPRATVSCSSSRSWRMTGIASSSMSAPSMARCPTTIIFIVRRNAFDSGSRRR